MKKLALIFCFLLFLSGCYNQTRPIFGKAEIIINAKYIFNAEIAETIEQKQYGLMHLKELPDDYAMLFVYEKEQNIMMWMKNTYVPLDMFFISEGGVINYIAKSTEPLSLERLESPYASKYILETKSGIANDLDINVGDKIKFFQN